MANLPSQYRRGSLWGVNENPFRELSRMQRRIDRIFDEMVGSWPERSAIPELSVPAFSPACDVVETDSHYVLSFDLPGIKKEDIKIELVDDELRVSGERKEEHEEKGESRYQMERVHGSFWRSIALPSGVKPESIETEYSEGVLRIAVPKVESSKARQIKVGEGKPGLFQKLLGQKKEEPKQAA